MSGRPSAPRATAAAVDVRSTVGPSRTATAPASVSAAISSSEMPPSGPIDQRQRIGLCECHLGQRSGGRLVQHQHGGRRCRRAPTRRARCVETTPSTVGMYGRRDWRAADRATARHRRSPLSTLVGPSQRATHRDACHATNASAPTSVASSMASSERSDFGKRLHDGDRSVLARLDEATVLHAGGQPALGDVLDDAVRHRARTVCSGRAPHRAGFGARWPRGNPRRRRRRRAHRAREACRRRTASARV